MGVRKVANNPTQDAYQPPGTNTDDWEQNTFGDINIGDLFWLNQNRTSETNPSFRKLDENQAMNLISREVRGFQDTDKIFQKI